MGLEEAGREITGASIAHLEDHGRTDGYVKIPGGSGEEEIMEDYSQRKSHGQANRASDGCPYDQQHIEKLCDLRDTICELAEQICTDIQNRYEPIQVISNLNFHLDAHYIEVWQMLNTQLKFLKRRSEMKD